MDNENAGVQPVEKEPGVENETIKAPISSTELDYLAALAEADKKLENITQERDNYKRGLLKAKGKVQDEYEEEPTDDVRSIVREEILKTQTAQIQMERENLIKKMAKENAEMKVALRNKSQLTNSSAGSGEQDSTPKDSFWSAEQLAVFKARKLDPDKVKEHYLKNKDRGF